MTVPDVADVINQIHDAAGIVGSLNDDVVEPVVDVTARFAVNKSVGVPVRVDANRMLYVTDGVVPATTSATVVTVIAFDV